MPINYSDKFNPVSMPLKTQQSKNVDCSLTNHQHYLVPFASFLSSFSSGKMWGNGEVGDSGE